MHVLFAESTDIFEYCSRYYESKMKLSANESSQELNTSAKNHEATLNPLLLS
jgi:hypothetical protein